MMGSRLMNYIAIVLGLFILLVTQTVLAGALGPTRDVVLDNADNLDTFNGREHINSMYEAAVLWAPRTAGMGLIVLGVIFEYRRQRLVAPRGRRPPPGP